MCPPSIFLNFFFRTLQCIESRPCIVSSTYFSVRLSLVGCRRTYSLEMAANSTPHSNKARRVRRVSDRLFLPEKAGGPTEIIPKQQQRIFQVKYMNLSFPQQLIHTAHRSHKYKRELFPLEQRSNVQLLMLWLSNSAMIAETLSQFQQTLV